MSKAIEYLRKEEKIFQEFLECYDEDQKEDEEYLSVLNALLEAQEAIAELEVQEAKQCKECKFADVDDQACTILTHAVLESDAMPKTFYCSLFQSKDT